jgi:Spy/CpxP family protein refolding chaperone
MFRHLVFGSALLGAPALFGCSHPADSAPPATAVNDSADDDAMSGLMEHHRFHHHGGLTLFVAMGVDTLGLPADRKAAVDKLGADLHAQMAPASHAEQTLLGILADGVAANNLDVAKIDAAVMQVAAAAAAVYDASTTQLDQLHAALTPMERAALVDKVESHWAVWQQANGEAIDAATADNGHLAALTDDLGLTADQVSKTRVSLSDNLKAVPRIDTTEIAGVLRAFGVAFRGEQFDAKSLAGAGAANAHMASWGAAYLAHFVEAVTPVLTPNQQSKFSDQLREHASHNSNLAGNQ